MRRAIFVLGLLLVLGIGGGAVLAQMHGGTQGHGQLNWAVLAFALMAVEFAVIYRRVKAWDDEQERRGGRPWGLPGNQE